MALFHEFGTELFHAFGGAFLYLTDTTTGTDRIGVDEIDRHTGTGVME